MGKGKYLLWMSAAQLARLRGWAMDGLSDEQIAVNVGVSRSTLSEWKIRYPPISEALAVGKDGADRIIENALFERARGYTIKVKKHYKLRRVEYDEKTGRKKAEVEELAEVEEDEHVPADVRAQVFWLTNRKRDAWKEHVPDGGEGDDEGTGVLEMPAVASITPPELEYDGDDSGGGLEEAPNDAEEPG